jgi:hypothetical protein
MSNTFSTTGGTSHSTTVSGLQGGQSYAYYVRCQDFAGNANIDDYPISFSVNDVSPPTGTYWVDDNGIASWANCEGVTPLSGTVACSLATANSNASAGDVINLRAGTYGTGIAPSNSGTSGNVITYQAYPGETPTITTTNSISINLDGNDYIKVDGITVIDSRHWVFIQGGSDYNEIVNGTFHGKGVDIGDKGFMLRQIGGPYNTHNWIHNNTMYDSGYVNSSCDDSSGVMNIGGASGDFQSNYNTIENNILYSGGHHILETFTEYNVIRNNVFHNESWMTDPGCEGQPDSKTNNYQTDTNGKYGNRNIQIYDGNGRSGVFNLIEGNRIGHAGIPPDDNGAHNLVITSPKNIIRYNFIFKASSDGLYFKQGSGADSDNNRAYNNTIYYSGYGQPLRTLLRRDGVTVANGSAYNVIKNNIIYDSKDDDCASLKVGDDCTTVNTYTNNWLTGDGDPLFTDTDVSDPTSTTLPNLLLQSGSGAINAGTYLTQANESGSSSTTLIVDDALYFQDGSWGSSLANTQADWIAIGTVSNVVQISSINYSTNTITLASARTWSDNANIWLYKDSAENIVLHGLAPDIGAHEESGGVPPTTPQCSDSTDNDSDGLTDYPNDPGCSSTTDDDEYNAPEPVTCTTHTYTPWNSCQSNNTQTRTVTSSSPSGCTGGTPTVSQSCTYTPPDTTSPTISTPTTSNLTTTSATITWTTNEQSTSYLDYGLTTSYGNQTGLSSLGTSFTATLSNLSDNTTYNYRITATDALTNQSQSINYTFTTEQAIVPDTTAPSPITNLSSSNITQTSADLAWTAPGDDNITGTAQSYDLRYLETLLSETTWNTASQLNGLPTPSTPGTQQSYTTTGLSPNTTYYFAIKTSDEIPNTSIISNIVSITTEAIIPTAIPGCTDTTAANYDSEATEDDGSCEFPSTPILGCTDTTATNYNAEATENNDSCIFPEPEPEPVPGCTDTSATNYDSQATENDNSCTFPTPAPTPPSTSSGQPAPSGGGSPSTGSGSSSGGSYVDTTPPNQPNNFKALPAESQITLKWNNPTNTDFVRVVIFRSTTTIPSNIVFSSAKDKNTLIYEGTDEEYTDTNLDNNTTYNYAIYAYDRKPNYTQPLIISAKPEAGQTTVQTAQAEEGTVQFPISNNQFPIKSQITISKITGPFSVGMQNNQVKLLQQILSQDKTIYPEGLTTGYYGNLTIQAVQRFQKKYNIVSEGNPSTTGYGLAGPQTRLKLNELYSSSISNDQFPRLPSPAGSANGGQAISKQISMTETGTQKAILVQQIKTQIQQLQQLLAGLLAQLVEVLRGQLGEVR